MQLLSQIRDLLLTSVYLLLGLGYQRVSAVQHCTAWGCRLKRQPRAGSRERDGTPAQERIGIDALTGWLSERLPL